MERAVNPKLKTALILATVALALFVGVVVRYWTL